MQSPLFSSDIPLIIRKYRVHLFVFFLALFIGLTLAHPAVLLNDEFITTNQCASSMPVTRLSSTRENTALQMKREYVRVFWLQIKYPCIYTIPPDDLYSGILDY